MRVSIALIALLWAVAASAQPPASSIERFVAAELPRSGAPGVAYAVVDRDGIRGGARGTMLADGGEKVTADTPFQIGSISKSFTALAIMQLVEAGKVDLDAGIGTYLEAFARHPAGTITVRQLLSHTSGYSTVQGNSRHAGSDADTLADYAAQIARWQPAYPAGQRWEYSNANYYVLGALVEAASGLDYATYVETRILDPLGMAHSFVADGRERTGVAVGHRPWFGGTRAYRAGPTDPVGGPVGGIFASANDLARYLAMMIDGEDDIVGAASKRAMLDPASAASPFYGLGWFVDVDAGRAYHGGLVPGTETLATLVPAEGRAAVVLVNANGGIGFGENAALRNGITGRALGFDDPGEGSRLWPRLTYLSVVLLPFVFLACMAWAWTHRRQLVCKTRGLGRLSLWFPLLAMAAMAGVLLLLVPRLFGGTLGTMLLYQPDFTGAMIAGAVTGPAWALVRLGLACGGRRSVP